MLSGDITTRWSAVCLLLAVGIAGCHEPTAPSPAPQADTTVIVYYFHRTVRCPACLALEARTLSVLQTHFSEPLATGRLVWLPFNLDDPGGQDLEKEYEVPFNTVVLSKVYQGQPSTYKRLDQVWDVVDRPEALDAYLTREIRMFIGE